MQEDTCTELVLGSFKGFTFLRGANNLLLANLERPQDIFCIIMVSTFDEDSPAFRKQIRESEGIVWEIANEFGEWSALAQTAFTKGNEYISSLNALYESIHDLRSSSSSFLDIKEVLSYLVSCEEGFLYALEHVFYK